MKHTLYLSPPSLDGFDGGAGARYQARREVTSYWFPTWLAQPAAMTPHSRLRDCPSHNIDLAPVHVQQHQTRRCVGKEGIQPLLVQGHFGRQFFPLGKPSEVSRTASMARATHW